jgi:hypothetical protein
MRILAIAVTLVWIGGEARADDSLQNWLIGPVLGYRFGGQPASRLVIGVEGGGGWGPERFNLGFEHRDTTDVGYIEIDPWYIVGGSFGFGIDNKGDTVPVLGVWEGVPLTTGGPCSGWHTEITLAGGYRYTGVHELYVTLKAGWMDGQFCLD